MGPPTGSVASGPVVAEGDDTACQGDGVTGGERGAGRARPARRPGDRQGVRLPRPRRHGRRARRRRAHRPPRPPGRRVGRGPRRRARSERHAAGARQGVRTRARRRPARAGRVGGVAVGRAAGAAAAHGVADRRGAVVRAHRHRARRRPRRARTRPTIPCSSGRSSADRAVLRLPPGADRYGLVRAAHRATDPGRQLLVLCPSVGEARDLAGRLRRDRVRRRRPARRRRRGGRRAGLGPGPSRGRRGRGACGGLGAVPAAGPGRSSSTSTTRATSRSRHRPGTPATSWPSGPGGPAPVPAGVAVPDARGARLGDARDRATRRRASGVAGHHGRRPTPARPRARPAVLARAGRPGARRRAGAVRPQPDRPGAHAGLRGVRHARPLRAVRRRRRPARARRAALRPVRHRATDDLPRLRVDDPEVPAPGREPGPRGARGARRRAGRRGQRTGRRRRLGTRHAGRHRHRGGAAPGPRAPTPSPSWTSTRSCSPPATGRPSRRSACWPGRRAWSGAATGWDACSSRPARPTIRCSGPRSRPTRVIWSRPRCRCARSSVCRRRRPWRSCPTPRRRTSSRRSAARSASRCRVRVDGAWRLRAPDHETLCDALAAVPRPPGRLRIEVDPLRI